MGDTIAIGSAIHSLFDIHVATFNNYYSIWVYMGIILASLTILDLEENENILGLEMLDDEEMDEEDN